MKEMHRAKYKERAWSLHVLSRRAIFSAPPCFHQSRSSLNPVLWAFMTTSLHRTVHACILSHSVVSNSLHPYDLQLPRFFCPWDFPGKHIGVHSHFLLQGIFLTQGWNPGLLQQQVNSVPTEPQGSPLTTSAWLIRYSAIGNRCILQLPSYPRKSEVQIASFILIFVAGFPGNHGKSPILRCFPKFILLTSINPVVVNRGLL